MISEDIVIPNEKAVRAIALWLAMRTHTMQDMEDYKQEAHLALWKYPYDASYGVPYSAYVYTRAMWGALDGIRRTYFFGRRTPEKLKYLPVCVQLEEASQEYQPFENPYEHLRLQELTSAVRRAIQKLPERMRLPVYLYYGEGLSYNEISRVVFLGENALKNLIQRACVLLRMELSTWR
jgi:RNA polymerase sigma factor (sigma-70 family)